RLDRQSRQPVASAHRGPPFRHLPEAIGPRRCCGRPPNGRCRQVVHVTGGCMTRQRVLAAIAAFAMAIAVAAPVGAAAVAPKKFKATRAFVVDKQTGVVRMPTPAEVDAVVTTLT